MKYFLDSIKQEDIKNWINVVDGITSNPILLKERNINNKDFLNEMTTFFWEKGIDKKSKFLFVQIFSIKEALELKQLYPGLNLVFKVSMHPKLYPLIRELKKENLQIAATTMYDSIQINQAIEMGCMFSMVYIFKNEYQNLLKDAYKIKKLYNSDIKLCGASFRGKSEVQRAILAGMDYSTVRTDVLEKTFKNSQLEEDFKQIYND